MPMTLATFLLAIGSPGGGIPIPAVIGIPLMVVMAAIALVQFRNRLHR